MPYYRLNFLDPQSLKIKTFDDFNAPEDESAVAPCETRRGDRPMELWCQARNVMNFESAPDAISDPGARDD